MNVNNCFIRSGAADFGILNYDCHCQHFKLRLVLGCLFLAFGGDILTLFVFVSISP